MKRILAEEPGWYVVRIDKPTTSQTFKGELRTFDHYYRVYNSAGAPIKYCKFQQFDRFAQTMGMDPDAITVIS